MVNYALNPEQIIALIDIMRDAYSYIEKLRSTKKLTTKYLAQYIQYPKIPSILSESLVLHLINKRKILKDVTIARAKLGGKFCDVMVTTTSFDHLRVEVKATAHSKFTELYRKDVLADYLIWVYYRNMFINKPRVRYGREINLYVVKQPRRVLEPSKITLKTFLDKISDDYEYFKCDYRSLR